MVMNDQATVNPPVPVTYCQIEDLGWHCCLHYTHYVIRIKKHLHNQIKIIEIERQ